MTLTREQLAEMTDEEFDALTTEQLWDHFTPEQQAAIEERRAALADMQERSAKQDARLKHLVVSQALREALIELDVPAKLMPAAQALLAEQLAIDVESRDEDYVPVVRGAYGDVTVQDAVGAWLATDDGRPFAPPAPVPGASFFTDRLGQLRRQIH